MDGEIYGFIPNPQLFGSTAVPSELQLLLANYSCFSLNLPCVGYYDDFGKVAQVELLGDAQAAFTEINETLRVQLKNPKSQAGPEIYCLGVNRHLAEGNPDAVAELTISAKCLRKLTGPKIEMAHNRDNFSRQDAETSRRAVFRTGCRHGAIRPGSGPTAFSIF